MPSVLAPSIHVSCSTTENANPFKRTTVWHALTTAEVLTDLAAHVQTGLSTQEVVERQSRYGPNRLAEAPPVARWKRFLRQFAELIVWILIAAALMAGLLGEWL